MAQTIELIIQKGNKRWTVKFDLTNATVEALKAKIEQLTQIAPFDQRIVGLTMRRAIKQEPSDDTLLSQCRLKNKQKLIVFTKTLKQKANDVEQMEKKASKANNSSTPSSSSTTNTTTTEQFQQPQQLTELERFQTKLASVRSRVDQLVEREFTKYNDSNVPDLKQSKLLDGNREIDRNCVISSFV
jgi:hypothetical protein